MSKLPWRPAHAHIIGIGGIGMSGVATLLRQLGCRVSGSELRESPLLLPLREAGIELSLVPSPELARSAQVLLRPGAVAENHPERLAARQAAVPELSRDQALLRLFEDQHSISVHGLLCRSSAAWASSCLLARLNTHETIGFCFGAVPRQSRLYAQLGAPMVLELGGPDKARSSLCAHRDPDEAAGEHDAWPMHSGSCFRFASATQCLEANVSCQPTHCTLDVDGHRFRTPAGRSQAQGCMAAIAFAQLVLGHSLAHVEQAWPPIEALGLEGHFELLATQPLLVHEIRTFPAAIQAARLELLELSEERPLTLVFRPYPFTLPEQLATLVDELALFQRVVLLPSYAEHHHQESDAHLRLAALLGERDVDVVTCDQDHAMRLLGRDAAVLFLGGDDLRQLAQRHLAQCSG